MRQTGVFCDRSLICLSYLSHEGGEERVFPLGKTQINLVFRSLIRTFAGKLEEDMENEFILRIFVAAILGGLIGLEREYRSKEAGFRTHFLVAMGSALFMIVSAYGFQDVAMSEAHRWDVSRIAAQVVSGIGFIGAGTIIFRKQENMVSGLTTAAGVWVVAAIGLACGGGMYKLAIASSILVLVGLEAFNYFLHKLDNHAKK